MFLPHSPDMTEVCDIPMQIMIFIRQYIAHLPLLFYFITYIICTAYLHYQNASISLISLFIVLNEINCMTVRNKNNYHFWKKLTVSRKINTFVLATHLLFFCCQCGKIALTSKILQKASHYRLEPMFHKESYFLLDLQIIFLRCYLSISTPGHLKNVYMPISLSI